MMNTRATTRYR